MPGVDPGLEHGDLHHPGTPADRCGGTIGARRAHRPVFGDIAIGDGVMIREVKLAPAAEKAPLVTPAPKISALAEVVGTVPLLAEVPLPLAGLPVSNGLIGSRPLYSRARTLTNGVAVLNVVVTVLAPAGAALMLCFAGP